VDNPANELHCDRCGDYDITYKAASVLGDLREDSPQRPKVSEFIWEQNSLGITPRISTDNIDSFLTRRSLPFFERAKRLLLFLADRTTILGTAVRFGSDLSVTAMLQTFHTSEVDAVAEFLQSQGWVHRNGGIARVLGTGFIRAEEWKQAAPQSTQGFVAMWFDDSTLPAWNDGLQKGISAAGFQPLRINMKEHVNKICDEIIAEIRRSRFVVADYTGQRGGVYYEAGFASGLGLPVILTCRKDEMEKLHFDIRQYNCIDWQAPDELARRLQVRIEAVIGDGPLKH
jgi:nucleoside 2-deoxyribosyltransferase